MKPDYQKTMTACFIAYIVQAIVNNFVPLLFVTFQNRYGIPLYQITTFITVNFATQLIVDLLATKLIDKIGYRVSIIAAHLFSAAGLFSLIFLPDLLPNAFTGILISVVIYAIGGGLLEVLVSPIMEACPTENKEKAMSLLHSFYCWGSVGVVLISTLFFTVFEIEHWKILALFWSAVPFFNMMNFIKAPIYSLTDESSQELSLRQLFSKDVFWILMLMMVCAGASEQTISQWASTFAEQGLGVSKTIGDLAGPMLFSFLMGIARWIYGKYGDQLDLDHFMRFSCLLCIASYLCISLVPIPAVGLLGCAVCGFSVGILWPGTFSKASASIKGGGTAMFALLALAGDLGCSGGPTLAGFVSSIFSNSLHIGILAAIIFPIGLLASVTALSKASKE